VTTWWWIAALVLSNMVTTCVAFVFASALAAAGRADEWQR